MRGVLVTPLWPKANNAQKYVYMPFQVPQFEFCSSLDFFFQACDRWWSVSGLTRRSWSRVIRKSFQFWRRSRVFGWPRLERITYASPSSFSPCSYTPDMSLLSSDSQNPALIHSTLKTTFSGTFHRLSSLDANIHQYLGIKYASIPARFRQPKICAAGSYPSLTDASKHGWDCLVVDALFHAHPNDVHRPICPQIRKFRTPEEVLFGIPMDEFPVQEFKQDEFDCLNMNIISPAGLTEHSNAPVMLWFHGCVSIGL